MQYLIPNIFEKKIARGALHTRSRELKDALEAVRKYWNNASAQNIQTVSKRLHKWKMTNPKEFADRGKPIETQLRAELKEEYARWGLTYGLGTDTEPAQPFLANKEGAPIHPNNISTYYYYHACNYEALRGIKETGLDPGHGGRGGAGDVLVQQGNMQGGGHFNARSVGVVHGTTATHTAVFYALLKDQKDIGFRKMSLILRFPKNIVPARNVAVDPDDPRSAFRISISVAASHIDALTTEGWVPISDLTELDAVL